MIAGKSNCWISALLLWLAAVAGGCAVLDDVVNRADPPEINWQTVTPAEVETLIESGALDPNAVYTGSKGAKFSPLMKAVGGKSDLDVLDALVRHGADMELHHGEYNRYLTPLDIALHKGEIEYARRLLELGADPVQAGNPTPPVFYTLIDHDADADLRKQMIELLLSYGADINAADRQGYDGVISNASSFTPLFVVVLNLLGKNSENYSGLLPYLVSRGADVNATLDNVYGMAMAYASWSKDAGVMKELIALGGDVNLINGYNCYTPLFYFIHTGQTMEIFDVLISAGADLDYSCSDGRNVMTAIRERKKGGVLYFYTKLYGTWPEGLINPDKFPTEQSWLDFADEIIARIKALCREKRYNICSQLEESGEAYAENKRFLPADPVFRVALPEAV